jgi:tRNA (cmo5U34)-methyltransferase
MGGGDYWMSEFERSGWSQSEYSREYRESADHYLPERRTLLRVVSSFYRRFVSGEGKRRVLDLGCGDGILAETLYAQDAGIEMVVTDGSKDMLDAARARLLGLPVVEFCQITFEEVIAGGLVREPFDLITSSFAIHHLDLAGKATLFRRIIELLRPNAYFMNVDVVLSDREPYTDWYYQLWQEWIVDRQKSLGLEGGFEHVPGEARAKPENHYDSLGSQLEALRSVGFVDVACHYRYGLFGVYGGKRPGEQS